MMTDKDFPPQLGSERFWPVTGDFPEEMEKAGRILRAFTGESSSQDVVVRESNTLSNRSGWYSDDSYGTCVRNSITTWQHHRRTRNRHIGFQSPQGQAAQSDAKDSSRGHRPSQGVVHLYQYEKWYRAIWWCGWDGYCCGEA
jgi:hypothetical protein